MLVPSLFFLFLTFYSICILNHVLVLPTCRVFLPSSVESLEMSSQARLEVCLLGDSKFIGVSTEDRPSITR